MIGSRFYAAWLLLAGCLLATLLPAQPRQGERIPFSMQVPDSALYPGLIAVKWREGMVSPGAANHTTHLKNQHPGLDAALRRLGVYDGGFLFQSAFTAAQNQEDMAAMERMSSWGLDRWQCLRFPEAVSPKLVWQALVPLALFEEVTPIGRIRVHGQPNDVRMPEQWYLQNAGQTGGSAGADIKAVPAWDLNTGLSSVLVSVHDGGILTTHPDLAQNIWPGTGFNFVANRPQLDPDAHATHVAGLLAAVRNNALGVSGLAGGDGRAGSGIRMMSLQIVGGTPVQAAHEALSFVYAANQGVSISQNSWSYQAPDYFPAYMADAIDYFVANGGGQMLKGGLALFSAGNYNSEALYYPAPYSRVIAVGATDHRDVRAPYSSYGSWVDLVAPGGETSAPILSTVLNNGYGSLFGTSMACPLASGAAALLVSHLPGRMLADDVRSLLLYGTDDIYPLQVAGLQNKMGYGRLNAFKSLLRADSIRKAVAPPPLQEATIRLLCHEVELSWQAPASGYEVLVAYVPDDQPMGSPFGLRPATGDSLPFGGRVVYKGNGQGVRLPAPLDGVRGHFRLWVYDGSAYGYSMGTDLWVDMPFSAGSEQITATDSSIHMQWQRQCPDRGLLLAFSTNGVFGSPAGDPAQLGQIPGGGNVLQYGFQSGFDHQGLQPDQWHYYALFPYVQLGNQWQYGAPRFFRASTACQVLALPIREGFAGTGFPPANWRLADGGPEGTLVPDGRSWQRSNLAGSTAEDGFSALLNAYTQNGSNSKEMLRTPAFSVPAGADSLVVQFDYAYRAYSGDAGLADSLELVWSPDCGTTLFSIWKQGGASLATVPGFSTAEFIPAQTADWRTLSFNVLEWLPPGTQTLSLGFMATNKFGQNIWLDNIAIRAYPQFRCDVALQQWVAPAGAVVCSGNLRPVVRVVNQGRDTLRTLQVLYGVKGGVQDSILFSTLHLPRGQDTTLVLNALFLPPGVHPLFVFSRLPNGMADEQPQNDTLWQQVSVAGTAADPHTQGFETGAAPGPGWAADPVAGGWELSAAAAFSGNRSLWVNRFADTAQTGVLELFSPVMVPRAGADSLLLDFALAAAVQQVMGQWQSDTLELWATTDCGASRQLVYRKAGAQLASTQANTAGPFVPGVADWRMERVDLTNRLPQLSRGFQIIFRLLRGGGNNVYLDNINLGTKTLTPALKQAGFGVFPNPFREVFTIWHLQPPVALRMARLCDAAGRVLQQWQWTGNAPQTLLVPASGLPKGMYFIQLEYDGFSRTQKLMKW